MAFIRRWGIVALVSLGAAVAQSFGRFTYGVLLPAIRDDLGLSNSFAGFIGSVNVAAYLIGTATVGMAAARLRLIVVMRVGLFLSVGGLLAASLAPNQWVLSMALFSTGLGGACIWIPAPVIAADSMPPERRSMAIGLTGSGIGIGMVFAGQLAALLRGRMGDSAWSTVYRVEAVLGFTVLVLTLWLVRHPQSKPAAQKSGFGGFAILKRMQGWKPLTIGYTTYGLCYLLVIAFLTSRLEDDSGWPPELAAVVFTVVGCSVILGGPLIMWIVHHNGFRTTLTGAFVAWAACALIVLGGWLIPTFAASVVLGLLFASIPGVIALYTVEHTSVDDYGPSYAAATVAFGVAQAVAPQLGGLIADAAGSFTPVFLLSAAVAVIGAATCSTLPDARPLD